MGPDDERVGRLIAAAFDHLPEPAPARLEAVEDRLALGLARRRKRSIPGWYWWLMVALAASGAAAWWSESWWRPAPDVRPGSIESAETPISAPRATQSRTEKERDPDTTEAEQERTPMIYRRERH